MTKKTLSELLSELRPHMRQDVEAPETACPPSSTLRRFLQNSLPEEQARQIAYHLLSCEHCAHTVLAWEQMEGEAKEEIPKTRLSGSSSRRRVVFRRVLLPAAALAALIMIMVLPYIASKPQFESEIQNAAGGVRAVTFTKDDAVELKVVLPERSYVYVVAADSKGVEFLFPEAGEEKTLEGKTVIPGDEAWKLSGIGAGRHMFLVGRKRTKLSDRQKTDLMNALRNLPDCTDKRDVRKAASPYFEEVLIRPFTVLK